MTAALKKPNSFDYQILHVILLTLQQEMSLRDTYAAEQMQVCDDDSESMLQRTVKVTVAQTTHALDSRSSEVLS